ncbi:MAG: glycyl-radical enzyme activating protein [Desulfobacterales bacterium]|nr:glycyl-radical enzyme activating protein [Desulfobacterales bacterium]
MEKQPLILEIKGNSLDDGPGIRTVVFFKGCPLSCIWCHNPESKLTDVEISFDSKSCIGCNTCIKLCNSKALNRDNPFFINRKMCNLCFSCISDCPGNALSKVGKEMSVDAIVDIIKKDIPFFKISNGGMTLSGGEPMLFMTFASELIKKVKSLGVHILLETSGYFDLEQFENKIYPYLSLIYYDIKIIDHSLHQKFCKVTNDRILKNFEIIYNKSINGGIPVIPRVPLIPGITATNDNLNDIASFFKKLGVKKTSLLPYNPLWKEKMDKIGVSSSFFENKDVKGWMKQEEIKDSHLFFKYLGIETE